MCEMDIRKMHETCLDCENDYLRGKVVNACRNCVYDALRAKTEKESQDKKEEKVIE